jgi:hypothetical protein
MTQAATITPSHAISFLMLPAELRHEVYEHVLLTSYPEIVWPWRVGSDYWTFHFPKSHFPLASTYRQLRHEFLATAARIV